MSNNKELPEDIREKISQYQKSHTSHGITMLDDIKFGYHLRDSEVQGLKGWELERLSLEKTIMQQSATIVELLHSVKGLLTLIGNRHYVEEERNIVVNANSLLKKHKP